MQLGHSGGIVAETACIDAVLAQQRRQHIAPLIVPRGHREDAPVHTEQPEFGEWRRFELLVGEDLGSGRVIHRQQPHLVQVRDLMQLLGDPDLVMPVHLGQRLAGDTHVLIVIHRKILPIARTRPQRRDTQHVGDELESAAVPRENHRAGAGKPRRFCNRQAAPGRLVGLVLDHPIGPGNADRVHAIRAVQAKQQRHSVVELLLVQVSRFDFDLAARSGFEIFHAGKRDPQPFVPGAGAVQQEMNAAVRGDRRKVAAAIGIEIGCGPGTAGNHSGRRNRIGQAVESQVAIYLAARRKVREAAIFQIRESEGARSQGGLRFKLPVAIVEQENPVESQCGQVDRAIVIEIERAQPGGIGRKGIEIRGRRTGRAIGRRYSTPLRSA